MSDGGSDGGFSHGGGGAMTDLGFHRWFCMALMMLKSEWVEGEW